MKSNIEGDGIENTTHVSLFWTAQKLCMFSASLSHFQLTLHAFQPLGLSWSERFSLPMSEELGKKRACTYMCVCAEKWFTPVHKEKILATLNSSLRVFSSPGFHSNHNSKCLKCTNISAPGDEDKIHTEIMPTVSGLEKIQLQTALRSRKIPCLPAVPSNAVVLI